MKVTYKELLERLSVNYDMQGYQTQPWQAADAENNATYSAEVRVMDGDCTEVEAEISVARYAKDNPDEPEIDVILWLQAKIDQSKKYGIGKCRFEGTDFVNKAPNWEDKICRFFRAVVQELKNNSVPDFAAIKEKAMEGAAGRSGGSKGSDGRSPKIQGTNLLHDMKKGGMGI